METFMNKKKTILTFLLLIAICLSGIMQVPQPVHAEPLAATGTVVITPTTGGKWAYIHRSDARHAEWYPTTGEYANWWRTNYDDSAWLNNSPNNNWTDQWTQMGWDVPSGMPKIAYLYSQGTEYSFGMHRQWFTIPAGHQATSVKLEIFADDQFAAHLNGTRIYTGPTERPQTITNIDPGLLKAGNNLFSISLLNISGPGGLTYRLTVTYEDKTPPTLGFAGADSNTWYNSNRVITAASSDPSGIAEQYVSDTNGNWRTSFTATQTTDIWCRAKDNSGNWAGPSVCGTVHIDKVKPTLGFSGATDGAWYNSPRTIQSASTDSGGSGLKSQGISTDNKTWVASKSINSTSDIYCRAEDNAGNVSQALCGRVNFDLNAPTVSVTKSPAGEWANQNVTVTATASDSGGSGLAGIRCKLASEGSWQNGSGGKCTRTAASSTTFQYYAWDNAGNYFGSASSPKTVAVNIDKINPTAVATKDKPGTWSSSDVNVSVSASDSGGSGVKTVYCKFSHESTWRTNNCNLTATQSTVLQYYVVDNAGNMHGSPENPLTLEVNIDKGPPLVYIEKIPDTDWASTDVLVIAHAMDTGAGLDNVFCKLSRDETWTEGVGGNCTRVATESDTFQYYAVDVLGNRLGDQYAPLDIPIRIERNAPTLGFNASGTKGLDEWFISDVVITPNSTDEDSGIRDQFVGLEPGNYDDSVIMTESGIVYCKAVDNAGILSEGACGFVYIDKLPPSAVGGAVEANGVESGKWQNSVNSPVFQWASASDTNSGLRGYNVYWGMDANGESDLFQVEEQFAPDPVSAPGIYYLRIQSMDNAGNTSEWRTVFEFRFDVIAPDLSGIVAHENQGSINNVWQNSITEPQFVWSDADGSASGVEGYYVYWGTNSNGESDFFQAGNEYAPEPVTESGIYFLRLRAKNHVGLLSEWKTVYVFKYTTGHSFTCEIDYDKGCEIRTPSQNQSITFPTQMVNESTWIFFSEHPVSFHQLLPYHKSIYNFSLEGMNQSGHVNEFNQPYTFVFHYGPKDVVGLKEETLAVYFWDEASGEWVNLDGDLDTANNTLTFSANHFTDYAVQAEFGEVGDALVQIFSGPIEVSEAVIEFPTVELNGYAQTTTATTTITARDATGTGQGWNIFIQAGDFISGRNVIPVSNFEIVLPSENIFMVDGYGQPVSGVEDYTNLDNEHLIILSAGAGEGMGFFEFSPIFRLLVPASAHAGTYTSEVLLTIVPGS